MQIAELYNLAPGTFAVTDLRVTVKNAYPPKPSTGQYGGHTQNAVVADASGEIGVFVFDGPELQRGMSILLTSTQGKSNRFEGVHTEVRESNGQQVLRLTVKGKAAGRVQILSGGQGAPQQGGFQGQQGGYAPQGQGWQPRAALQDAQAAWQPREAPPAQQGWQRQPQQAPALQSSGSAWKPKPKMTDAQARELLVSQFEKIVSGVEGALGAAPNALEETVLGHCMAWATTIFIGVQRGEIEVEKSSALPAPQSASAGPEQWPGQVPPMQTQGWQAPQGGQQAPPQGQAWSPPQGGGQGQQQARWDQSDNLSPIQEGADDDISF